MAFINMWSELVGTVPELSAFLAQSYIRKAWTDVAKSRSWSWKQQVLYLNSPVAITAGTVAVTQFSTTVTADVTAKAALNAASAAGNPPLVGRQFRKSFRGPIYTISAYDTGTGVITLDQPYQSATDPTSMYTVYQCLYQVPGVLVNKFTSIVDPNNGYAFTQMHVPKAVLDSMDPTRSSQQLPFWLVDYDALGTTENRSVRYEFWPHPITAQTFVCTVQLLQTLLTNPTDTLPGIIPEDLVIAGAFKKYVCPWITANSSRFPRLAKVNVAALYKMHHDTYIEKLAETKKDDDGRMLNSRIVRRTGLRRFPLDANWMQNHDWRRL